MGFFAFHRVTDGAFAFRRVTGGAFFGGAT